MNIIKKAKHKKRYSSKAYSYFWLAVMILSFGVVVLCAITLIVDGVRQKKAADLYNQLASGTQPTEPQQPIVPAETEFYGILDRYGYFPWMPECEPELTNYQKKVKQYKELYGVDVPDKNIDFENLHETITPDIYGWIYIPDTNIDYPLLRHPSDNSYWLEHNLDGSTGYPGCIYTENYNSMDFTDRHTAIYGHNMRDGTMFSDLHLYENNAHFMEQSPYVFIYMEDDVLVYRIFAAYETDNTHPVLGYKFNTDQDFLDYLAKVSGIAMREEAYLDFGREFTADDRLLTLSTCGMAIAQPLIRYLVQAIYLDPMVH